MMEYFINNKEQFHLKMNQFSGSMTMLGDESILPGIVLWR